MSYLKFYNQNYNLTLFLWNFQTCPKSNWPLYPSKNLGFYITTYYDLVPKISILTMLPLIKRTIFLQFKPYYKTTVKFFTKNVLDEHDTTFERDIEG